SAFPGDWSWSLARLSSPFPRADVDPEVAQLAVQVGPLHAGHARELADAAAAFAELVQQVGALELVARFAQRQREVDRVTAGSRPRDRRRRRRRNAERGFDFGDADFAAAEHAEALHEAAQ